MDSKKVLEILEKAQAKGAAITIQFTTLVNSTPKKASDLNIAGDYENSAKMFYTLFVKENNLDKKIHYGVSLVQVLINASNLDKAEEILNELEKLSSGEEKFMGAIYEKRGWLAECRTKWNDEIRYFKKAGEIYKKCPRSLEIEGHKDDRFLTIEHFTARALYFKGKKSGLKKCEELFSNNLEGYRALKSDGGVAFNYSWLARVLIKDGRIDEAEEMVKKSEEYFNKGSEAVGESAKAYIYRIKAEFANAKGQRERAIEYSIEALRYTLPPGTYYNGVIEAVKEIIKASES